MTIPMIPGWGDELAQSLPSIGLAIRDILMPNKQYEVALRQALASDPTLAGKLATIEKDNPGAVGAIYGPNAGAFASGLRETPDARLQRQITGAASSVAGNRTGDVGAAALGIESDLVTEGRKLNNQGQKIQNEGGQVALDRSKLFSQIFNALPPELQNDAVFVQHFGVPKSEYEKVQRRAKNMKDAEPLMELGANQLIRGFVSGKYSTDQIQGWIDNNPDSSKAMLELLAFDKEAKLRRELSSLNAKDNRRDFMQLAYIETVKDARKLGVNPVALFKYQTGQDANVVVPEFAGNAATPEEVKAAEDAYTRHIQNERSRALRPVSITLKSFEDDPSTGSAAALNAALSSANIPIEVVWDTKGWNEKKYFLVQDDGSRVEIDSDVVSQAVATGELPEAPGAGPKTNSGDVSTRTATGGGNKNFNQPRYDKLSSEAKKIADTIKAKGYDRKTVVASEAYKKLPLKDKDNLIATFGW